MAAIQYLYPEQAPKTANQQLVAQSMELAQYMADECMIPFRPTFARGILRYLAQGFTAGLIRAVIDETAMAPYPSWAYFATIMRRAESEGAYTLDAFRPFRPAPGRTVSAQRYTQREYTEAELLAVSDDLFEEARRLRKP